ncbi:MAG: M55 family metallopeptidase [Candidatus Marinimicrobia bacterium]|jgi:D-amino peptidase|nr:M55 family metallopeptidase [Candidatus Neomarinimicrobiota bacterium]MBT4149308.1 M55 family metallopeptidase [Candidatus Neomarinimicrobiota bacterium]MBT4318489.1 M55 family metallopeptidase [Candidatus Neomarinimicrobiota bacterium]MBT4784190.1 M55 family metallopeptidase [Candidatus Neomarinimicrobiota bacterium]MBT5440663.1 M55 family metallopeptidase [Candidatus Neomarinimicrobiota bacterium]
MKRFKILFYILLNCFIFASSPLKIFISVDMEGIGGIGTAEMTRSNGKDYQLGRKLMTAEVNAVVSAIIKFNNDAQILVNDSHGDMQNLIHQELDPKVVYIQGNKKPYGMVQGLDESYDAAIFIGYHARAGTAKGFLAHTGSGAVKGLWLNNREVGEGGLNTYFSGEMDVPIILAAGDDVFTKQFGKLVDCELVATKNAVTAQVAKLKHGTIVERELFDATTRALKTIKNKRPIKLKNPVEIKLKFSTPTHAEILQAIPGMEWVDGYTVKYKANNMVEAYALIRLMYKYVKP